MHLVDNVNFIFAFRGRIGHLIPNLTNIVHTVIGGRVDLNNIHGRLGVNSLTHLTFIAWTSVHRMKAIDRFGKNFCHGGLARAPGSTKQVGMPIRSALIWFLNVVTMWSCPFTSSNSEDATFYKGPDKTYQSPKQMPRSLAWRMISEFGSTVFSFPATSLRATGTIESPLKATIYPYFSSMIRRAAAAPRREETTRS